MTKHTKLDVNETVLKYLLKKLEKSEIQELIKHNLNKEDLILAVVYTWNQKNIVTNTNIERYINNNVLKKINESNWS